jgi:hypothetical protein
MKKLIQTLIVCVLVVVMGGTASGDSLKRLSCFESKKNSKVTEATNEETSSGDALSPSLVFSATTLGALTKKKKNYSKRFSTSIHTWISSI